MRIYINVLTVLFSLILLGCGGEGPAVPVAMAGFGAEPALGAQDEADRACRVVLRDVMRLPGGEDFATRCQGGACQYVWTGRVDVSRDAYPSRAEVGVLYRGADGAWREVAAGPVQGGRVGFFGYSFEMSDGLFGPEAGQYPEGQRIELVPFIRRADGTRLFDHNRHPGDGDNHVLDATNGYGWGGDDACAPVAGTVTFSEDWSEHVSGTLHAGGWMSLWYDLDRLSSCRATHNGYPAWDLVAYAYFLPVGELATGSVRSMLTINGSPTNDAVEQPLELRIPRGATSVEVWFQNYSGAGNNCQNWDSDFGANYRFEILPPVDDARCQDVERWNRIYGGEASCIRTMPEQQYDATNCEFTVTGFGHGYEGHYGIPVEWLEAYLHVGAVDGEPLEVGMLTRFTDTGNGVPGETFSLGTPMGDGTWKTGFTFHAEAPQGRRWNYRVDQVAFFLDVRRPSGSVVRLWQSRRGANYSWDDAFGAGVTRVSIPYGNVQWANDGAGVFDSRRACQ
ncbi:MAG: hypothetical protein HY904_21680 [Deltaproteobacteria bacterium]|nr:hypothetical protein [Deltaproteobacteria bacterium]